MEHLLIFNLITKGVGIMFLYELPEEIYYDLVKLIFDKNYSKSTPVMKLHYKYWKLICECLHLGGRHCPTFKTFLRYVRAVDMVEAIKTYMITTEDIGGKDECISLILTYYREKEKKKVIYVDFNKSKG